HIDAATMHRRIADRYGARRGPEGWDGVDWSRADDYGIRHVAAHLHALRDDGAYRAALYALIRWPFIRENRLRYGSHEPITADLVLAVDAAHAESPSSLVEEIRSSVAHAILDALTTDVQDVVREAVRRESHAVALAFAACIPSPAARAGAHGA